MPPNLIVIRIDGRDFRRFSEVNEFEKLNDEKALNLMNQCAMAVLEEYPDIAFSYGYSDEYSFVLKKTSKFYQRRSRFSFVLHIECFLLELDRMLKNKTEMNFSINSLVLTTMIVLHCFVRELVFSRMRFSDIHEFNKPNDKQALDLMNLCSVAVLKEFQDIIFSYGVSDEYSFVLKKASQLSQRRASEIVSVILSFFSSTYVMKWKDVFLKKELKYPPSFDGRAATLIISTIPVSGVFLSLEKSKSQAQSYLKGTQAPEKNELLFKEFGIDYNTLPLMFRQGSSIFRVKTEKISILENGASVGKTRTK
ncbi:hypothetical protein CRYUN_Cryun37aG0124500 [Craigia yunnanensis]